MNTSGVNPTHGQRFFHSPPVTGSGSAQASPAGTLCAAYRDALENLASPLCQNLLVDSCMERRLRVEEGGFLESHEVSQVQQQSDAVQKMETLLSILRTKDDQAFRGFIEWLCDSDSSRSWGQALAEQAGLSGAAVSGQSGGHLERRALRRRALGEVPVIQVPPGPNRLGTQAADASGDLEPFGTAVSRGGRWKIACQQFIETASTVTGCVVCSVWAALPGLLLVGIATAVGVTVLTSEYHENEDDILETAFLGFTCGIGVVGIMAVMGARLGVEMGAGVGRGLSRLLGRPAAARFNGRGDLMAFEHRQQPRRQALRHRPLGGVPVIQVPPGPNRLGADASGADPADAAVRREGRCRILCRQVIELTSIATVATGCLCGTVCGSLPGLFMAGKAIELMVYIPPEYNEDQLLNEGIVGCVGLFIGGGLAMGLAMVGGTIGMVMGEGIGIAMGEVIDRGISGLLGRPVLPRLNERDMMAFEHRQQPRRQDPRRQDLRQQDPRRQEPRQQGCFLLYLFGGRGPQQEPRRDDEAPA